MATDLKTLDVASVKKLTALPEGCVLLMLDSSGRALMQMDSDRFMELVCGNSMRCGRNLVSGSAEGWHTDAYAICNLVYSGYTPTVGDRLTITCWGELGTDRATLFAINGGGDGTRGQCSLINVAPGVFRGTLTIQRTDGANSIRILHSPAAGKSASRLDFVKVELGDTGTYWTPSPEDLEKLGGVKITFSTLYALKPSAVTEKGGVRHEQVDGIDRGNIALVAAECPDKARKGDFGFKLGQLYKNRFLHDGCIVGRESSGRISKKRTAGCAEPFLSGSDSHSRLFGRFGYLPHKMVRRAFPRMVRNFRKEIRHNDVVFGKEVVAA